MIHNSATGYLSPGEPLVRLNVADWGESQSMGLLDRGPTLSIGEKPLRLPDRTRRRGPSPEIGTVEIFYRPRKH